MAHRILDSIESPDNLKLLNEVTSETVAMKRRKSSLGAG